MRFYQTLSRAIISSRDIRLQTTAPAHLFLSEVKIWLTPGLALLLSEELAGVRQPWKSKYVKTSRNSAFESTDPAAWTSFLAILKRKEQFPVCSLECVVRWEYLLFSLTAAELVCFNQDSHRTLRLWIWDLEALGAKSKEWTSGYLSLRIGRFLLLF